MLLTAEQLEDSPNEDDIWSHASVFYSSCLGQKTTPSESDLAILKQRANRLGVLDPRNLTGYVFKDEYNFIDEDPFMLNKTLVDFFKIDL